MAGNEQGTAVDHGQCHAALPRVGGVETRLADFVAHLPGFAYIIRRDGSGRFGLPFVSPGFEDKFGISHDSVRDDIRPLRALYHPDDRARIEHAFDASAELLTPLIVEYRAFHPLRGTFWIETRAAPQAQDDGSILWHGIALDITDRKQVEEELCAREREFRTVAESSIDLIFRYDRHCRRIYVNPAVCKLMGRSREALLGGLPSDNTLMLPGEQGQAYMAAIRQVFQSGCVGRFLMAFPLSGTIVHYDVQLIPELDASGEVASVHGVARDVSLLKDSERRTDRYFAGMPGFAFTLRVPPQGRWTLPFVSRGIDDLYGLCPDDVRDNASRLLEVVHPDDRPLLAEQQRTALRTRQPFQVEFRLQRPGHDTRWVECRAMCEEDLDGALAWHGVVLDINERRGLEEQMLKERATLRAFFRTLPALAWIKDVEGRYLACNPQFEQFFGASEHTIVGKTDFDFVDGELARFFREKDLLALTVGSACVNEEWVTFASDGEGACARRQREGGRCAGGGTRHYRTATGTTDVGRSGGLSCIVARRHSGACLLQGQTGTIPRIQLCLRAILRCRSAAADWKHGV
jgi:PAS domain S-box-containing protein